MRARFAPNILFAAVSCLSAVTSCAAVAQTPACADEAQVGDNRNFECPFDASGASQRFSFKAFFSGGHDDTSASLQATLNDKPLVCDRGSKTSLMGEDGEIALECKFTVSETAARRLTLKAAVSWRHAQYTGFEFKPD